MKQSSTGPSWTSGALLFIVTCQTGAPLAPATAIAIRLRDRAPRQGECMDAPNFDHLSRSLAALGTRRSVLRALTGVPLLGTTLAVTGVGQAARKHRNSRGVHGETFNKRKATYCLNGETIRRLRRKQKKLLAQGAVRGRCRTCVANDGACGAGCCGRRLLRRWRVRHRLRFGWQALRDLPGSGVLRSQRIVM